MWFRIILTATALAVVLYLQFCFDFKEVINEKKETHIKSEVEYSLNR